MRIIVTTLIVTAGVATLALAQAPQPGSDPNFTGVVTAMDAKDVTGRPQKLRRRRADRRGIATTGDS